MAQHGWSFSAATFAYMRQAMVALQQQDGPPKTTGLDG